MSNKTALHFAINFLSALKDSSLYDDYVADECITDEEYDEMLKKLQNLRSEPL